MGVEQKGRDAQIGDPVIPHASDSEVGIDASVVVRLSRLRRAPLAPGKH